MLGKSYLQFLKFVCLYIPVRGDVWECGAVCGVWGGGVYSDTHANVSQWTIFSSVDSQMSSNMHFETESYLS